MVNARALRLNDADNVAVLLCPAAVGSQVTVAGDDAPGIVVVAVDELAVGHKIAVADVPSGGTIRKYGGEVIGVASRDIRCGEHVHEHNVRSVEPGGPA